MYRVHTTASPNVYSLVLLGLHLIYLANADEVYAVYPQPTLLSHDHFENFENRSFAHAGKNKVPDFTCNILNIATLQN